VCTTTGKRKQVFNSFRTKSSPAYDSTSRETAKMKNQSVETEQSILQSNKPTPETRESRKTYMSGGGVRTTARTRA